MSSASSKKEVSFKLEREVGYVKSNCMGRADRQFKREFSYKLGKGVENVTSNCMGRAVRQFENEVTFRRGTGVEYVTHQTVWDAPSASSKEKVVLK